MRRLIVLCDGTGNSSTRGSKDLATNVKRFEDALDPVVWELACECPVKPRYIGSTWPEVQKLNPPEAKNARRIKPTCPQCQVERVKVPQIVYYQSGVGTSSGMGDISHSWQLGTGAGINDNILEAYHFLASNYNTGDEIFIFGFSRGAFTARVVANLVAQLGLFYKDHWWMMRKAWTQYKQPDDGISFKYFVESLWKQPKGKTRVATVKVLGVWDTVDSVGVPDYIENNSLFPRALKGDDFYQPHLVYGIEHCFHALALDEYRRTFNPTLFFLPDPEGQYLPDPASKMEKKKYPPIVLRQCWFPGVHSNIGGSYPSEHLADITLAWMIDQCNNHGDLLVFSPYLLNKLVDRHLNPYKNQDEYHTGGDETYPGWGCGTIYDSYSGKRAFLSWQYRTPGNYCTGREHRGSAGWFQLPEIKIPTWIPFLGSSSTPTPNDDECQDCVHPGRYSHYVQGATNETIHASVFARYKASVEYDKPENQEKQQSLVNKEQKMMEKFNAYRNKDKGWVSHQTTKAVSLLKWDPGALAAFKRDGVQADNDKTLDRYNRSKDTRTDAWIWTGRCLKTGKRFYMWEEPAEKPGVCGLVTPSWENGQIVYKAKSPLGKVTASLMEGEPKPKPQLTVEQQVARDKNMEDHKYLGEGFKVSEDYKQAELKRRKEAKEKLKK